MGIVRTTEAALPWGRRVGGGYPSMRELELAADMLEFDVIVGKPHPAHGFFMIRDITSGLKPESIRA